MILKVKFKITVRLPTRNLTTFLSEPYFLRLQGIFEIYQTHSRLLCADIWSTIDQFEAKLQDWQLLDYNIYFKQLNINFFPDALETMIKYSNEQLATIVALPTITILLVWTVAIFHKNRKRWGPYDIPIIAVLVLSIIRNLTILSYLLALALGNADIFSVEYCSVIVWIFNSLHTFQASSLTTIAVIGLFSVKLHRKQQNLKLFLTPTHIIYHLFCLTTLCACVGVAAILAQTDKEVFFEIVTPVFEIGPCRFMPFNLDIKYNVFILVLHLFLAVISLVSFLIICYNFYRNKNDGFEYIKKSTSDLSDMSLANTLNLDSKKGYFDTYTIHKGHGQNMESSIYDHSGNNHLQNGCCANRDINWNSDLSTTVSSTNSRKPCIGRHEREEREPDCRTGLETIHPVLIVCYLFYHLPLIVSISLNFYVTSSSNEVCWTETAIVRLIMILLI